MISGQLFKEILKLIIIVVSYFHVSSLSEFSITSVFWRSQGQRKCNIRLTVVNQVLGTINTTKRSSLVFGHSQNPFILPLKDTINRYF